MKADKLKNASDGRVELTGKVIQKKFGIGSKSEHEAIYFETPVGVFQLRRLGGNPFYDQELNKLLGKIITATGIVNDKLFIATTIKTID
ncbi:MAG: hypothetical protein ABI416_11630 [Ginsengibacter sp.]